jgi:cell wall-associated NlpC family hydrolase
MRLRQTLLAAGLATTLGTASVVALTATSAAAARPDHLVVLAGSPLFVAYGDYPVGEHGQPDFRHGELHVYSVKGRDRDLGGNFGNANPNAADPFRYSIVDSTLTGYSDGDPTHVKWWDLAASTHGVATLPAGARWQGSAPGGWVAVASDNETLFTQTAGGTDTTYGQPLPDEVVAGGTITAIAGTNGVVSRGAESGTAAYQPWDAPSDVTPLNLGASQGSTELRCFNVTGVLLACSDNLGEGNHATHIAVPLDGSEPRFYSSCGQATTAVMSRLVWTCGSPTAHPRFTTGHGKVARSTARTTVRQGVSALGRFVTLGPRDRALIAIRNAHRDARVLVAIPSPIIKYDDANLRAAARDVAAQAVASGALSAPPAEKFPAQILQTAADALIRAARARHPSTKPHDTRSVMGRVPHVLRHHVRNRPPHRHIKHTRSLKPFRAAIHDPGSGGIGTNATHGGASAAPFRAPDGVYVRPDLDMPDNPTISMVAIRAALQKLGQPYVWAGGGPVVFDCSGLTQWAYAHAGVGLVHYTVTQWNEGRLIKPHQILPGDLILFAHPVNGHQYLHHVGIYVGAGWMVNAPYTGQYVSMRQVPSGIAGIVRP